MGAVQAVETIRLGVRMDTMAARTSGGRYNTYFSCEHLFGPSAAEAAHEGCRGARSRGRLRGRGECFERSAGSGAIIGNCSKPP